MGSNHSSDAGHSLEDHPKIKQVLNGEKVLWAGRVTQLAGARSKELKVRVLIVSDSAIYKVRAENLGKVKRRIDLKDLEKISYNLGNNNFIMHCVKYDYRYSSGDCSEIVGTINTARKAWDKKYGVVRTTPFLVNSKVTGSRLRENNNSISFTATSNRGGDGDHRGHLSDRPQRLPLTHTETRGGGGRREEKGGFLQDTTSPLKDDIRISLKEQTANFRMCFCVAGYRMCSHVHPGLDNPNGTSESTAASKSSSATTTSVDEQGRLDVPGGGLNHSAVRRKKPATSPSYLAAQRLRTKNEEKRHTAQMKDDELNGEALDNLLGIMQNVRRQGIIYLSSLFVRDKEAFLKNQGHQLNHAHMRQVRKARNEQKRKYPHTNPAIDQFLRAAKTVELIQLAGLKLLESVYNLPRFHLNYLRESINAIEDSTLIKAKQIFRKIARQLEERKYDLLLRIGQGAFGSVYMARPLQGRFKKVKKGAKIAVKAIDLSGEEDLAEINKEIEALAEGEICPQLVHYYGCETVDRFLMLSMELMDGSLDKLKPLSEEAVAVVMREALLGLSFLWNKYKKFHRDLKAANILWSISGEVKLADFGCVRSLGGNTRLATTYVGSPYWMAPEVIRNEPYDQLVDVWSLGVTCVEIVTGKVPYYNKAPQIAMQRSINNPEPRLAKDKYSEPICDFVIASLQKDPSQRCPIDELLEMKFIKEAGELRSWLPGKARHLHAKMKDKERKELNRVSNHQMQQQSRR